MRAKLSVVIPTLNAARALERSLPALTEGVECGLIRELVISDGGSQDETLLIADAAGAKLVSGPPSRGGQLRRGGEVAQGEWILFLHADCVLPTGWSGCVKSHLPCGRPGFFKLSFDKAGLAPRFVSMWANFRSRYLGLPYGDQALLIRRKEYDQIGGYPDIVLMEDVAIVRSLKKRLSVLPATISTSAEKYEGEGWFRRGFRNLSLLSKYFLGADPDDLSRRY